MLGQPFLKPFLKTGSQTITLHKGTILLKMLTFYEINADFSKVILGAVSINGLCHKNFVFSKDFKKEVLFTNFSFIIL